MKALRNSLIAFAVCIVTLVSVPLSAQSVQESVREELPAFSGIRLGGDFTLEIRYGKQYRARMAVEEVFAEYVDFQVADGVLTVSMDDRKVPMDVRKLFRAKDGMREPAFQVIVTMPETLSSLHLSERAVLLKADELVVAPEGISVQLSDNARIESLTTGGGRTSIVLDKRAEAGVQVNCDSLAVSLSGNASLILNQQVLSSKIEIVGGSSLVVGGSAKELELTARGSSKSILNGMASRAAYLLNGMASVNAVNLKVEQAQVQMSGMCSMTQAAGDLTVDLSGGATLEFQGDPLIHVLRIKNATMTPYDAK